MDVIWRRGRATVAEVLDQLGDPPSYSAVRAMLRILEEKGHLRHEQDGPRYVYLPTTPREVARDSALRHLVRTFFGGSVTSAAAALLELPEEGLSEGELERLARILKQSGEEER